MLPRRRTPPSAQRRCAAIDEMPMNPLLDLEHGPRFARLEGEVDRAGTLRPGAMDYAPGNREQVAVGEHDLLIVEFDHEPALDNQKDLVRFGMAVPLKAGSHHAHANFMIVDRCHPTVVIRLCDRTAFVQWIDRRRRLLGWFRHVQRLGSKGRSRQSKGGPRRLAPLMLRHSSCRWAGRGFRALDENLGKPNGI